MTLEDEVDSEFRKLAEHSGQSLEKILSTSLKSILRPRRVEASSAPFMVRAKALHAHPGINFDNIDELLDQIEGPTHR